jgi:Ni/Co efflux regulator RcnB
VKAMLTVLVTGALLSGTVLVHSAEAGDRRRGDDRRRVETRHEYRHDGYFRGRDVVVIRDYYRPRRGSLPPGLRHRYARAGYLPPGWARRMRPLPVYVERQLGVAPRGYRRGVIDGHAVVYNDRGFILDVAVLF